jgi:hypothetical protein
MDIRDLAASLKTVRIKTISVCDYLGEQNVNMAFLGAVEAENRLDSIIAALEDEINQETVPEDMDAQGTCSHCPNKEAHWVIDPYMLDLYDETHYMFICYKCYQERMYDI